MANKDQPRLAVYVPKPDREKYTDWYRMITGNDPTEQEWVEYRDAMLKMRGDFPNAYDDLEQMINDAVGVT